MAARRAGAKHATVDAATRTNTTDPRAIESLGVTRTVRERFYQHRMDHADDGRVGAETERQCGDGDEREGAILEQRSDRIATIRSNRLQPRDGVHVVDVFANERRVAQLPLRCEPRLSEGMPEATYRSTSSSACACNSASRSSTTGRRWITQRRRETAARVRSNMSRPYDCVAVRSSRAITVAMRSQFLASAVSCFRPARVIA